MNSPEATDYARLLEATSGDSQLAAELIGIFVADYPQMLTEAEAAARDSRYDDLHRIAHTFKGNLRFMGAEPATEAAIMLESMAMNHDMTDVPAAIEHLRGELIRLEQALVRTEGNRLP